MENAKVKKILIIIIILLLLLLVCFILLIDIKNKEKSSKNIIDSNEIIIENAISDKPTTLYTNIDLIEIKSSSAVVMIQNCINKYYEYNSNQELNFIVMKGYEKEISFDRVYKYYVYGETYTNDYKKDKGYIFIVTLDYYNSTFSIEPSGEADEKNYIESINKLLASNTGEMVEANANKDIKVEKNNYNEFEILGSDKRDYLVAKNYFNYYKYLQVNNINLSYSLIDKEYKEKRFSNEQDYYNYAKRANIIDRDVEYAKKIYTSTGETNYIVIDKKGRYYIFIEDAPMKIKIMLDSYTMPLEETINKYKSSEDISKVCMCLETVKEMINTGDYNSIYSHLNETFRANNFKSIDELKNYINSEYKTNNKFEYTTYSVSGSNYIVKVKVSEDNGEQENNKQNNYYKEINFIVRLGSDINDFEMSFEK